MGCAATTIGVIFGEGIPMFDASVPARVFPTDLGVDAVARRAGISDGVSLRPHFRRIVGVPPVSYRAASTGQRSPGR